MTKNLNKEMIKIWTKYGDKIYEVFGFKNHIIDSKPLEIMFNEPLDDNKVKFIKYCEEQIELLNNLE